MLYNPCTLARLPYSIPASAIPVPTGLRDLQQGIQQDKQNRGQRAPYFRNAGLCRFWGYRWEVGQEPTKSCGPTAVPSERAKDAKCALKRLRRAESSLPNASASLTNGGCLSLTKPPAPAACRGGVKFLAAVSSMAVANRLVTRGCLVLHDVEVPLEPVGGHVIHVSVYRLPPCVSEEALV
ncbi:hypothetical protein HPB47_018654 [Ixodes persulcatus]|uniref:Uncharacterized protein n=1 Tax=Ixodes persulcatus TaxID=34615 RepID=A0AC60R303_IXOPE|nr:hypothetical protein HPB47_018654 [Ixodes persulcatus]